MKLKGAGADRAENGRKDIPLRPGLWGRFFIIGTAAAALASACDSAPPANPPRPAPETSVAASSPASVPPRRVLSPERQAALDRDLAAAVTFGRADLVRGLVGEGANPNLADRGGNTSVALAYAWQSNNIFNTLQTLFENGADPNRAGFTFIRSVENRCERIVRLYLEHGMDPNHQDYEGRTALMAIMVPDQSSFTLHAGESRCLTTSFDSNIVQALLDAGADVNLRDRNGRTALAFLASTRFGSPSMARALLSRGANVDSEDSRGMTPLHEALFNNNASIVPVLLDAGADVNHRSNDGMAPLMYPYGDAAALLRAGADPLAVDRAGQTALHHSFHREAAYARIRALLEGGVNPNAREYAHGETAFMMAARGFDVQAMELLLARGANPAIRNDAGEDAYAMVANSRRDIQTDILEARSRGAGRERLNLLRYALNRTEPAMEFLRTHRVR
jgi:ankyrin repeat protein